MKVLRTLCLPVAAIALNSYREALRSKVLSSLIVLPFILLGLGSLLGEMSLHNELRVTTNLGLLLTKVFTVVIAIYVSLTLMNTEIERRTIYTLLSKPLYRWQFLLGKFAGVVAICATVVVVLGGISGTAILYRGGELGHTFFAAYFLVFLQAMIITSLATLFATFSTPLLSGLFAFGMFLAGNIITRIDDAIAHFREAAPLLVPLLEASAFSIPNFEALNLNYELLYSIPIPNNYLLSSLAYTFSYSGVVLTLAVWIFGRRDFA